MNWLWWSLAAAVVLLVAGVGVANVVGAARWAQATAALQAALTDAAAQAVHEPAAAARHDPEHIATLPAPVQRYFRAVLRNGQPMVSQVSVTHSGTFNIGQGGDLWRPFRSTQQVTTRRPGFVWDGTVAALPGVPVHVHDAYIAGQGILRPALFGLFKLADMRGGGDLARGELMRYLAEAAWYPTALLPSQGVRWTAVDERSALATLADGAVAVSLHFHFGDDGLIERVSAAARGYTQGQLMLAMPWEGIWSDWQWQQGMLVPMRGEVAWLLPQGRKAYWRGTIVNLRHEFER